MKISNGLAMYQLASRLFSICRSITGNGVRETLRILQEVVPQMELHEVPTGTQVFDWVVPKEWNIRDAYIEDLDGNRIISFSDNNLHVVGYSAPIDKIVTRDELFGMIHTLPEYPDAIPYVTSYYTERSHFCMSEKQKRSLDKDRYHVYIDSDLKDGSLTYGEIFIPETCGGGGMKRKCFSRHMFVIRLWLMMTYQVHVSPFIWQNG